jgi:hypothetical protein
VVTGDVVIGPFHNDTTIHINLDGIEVIEGDLRDYRYGAMVYDTQPYYTLSSRTLKKALTVAFGSSDSKIVNLTLPSLTSVSGYVGVYEHAYNLTYLDISSLESVQSLSLSPPSLTTLHHTRLRNASLMIISSMQVGSLDSLVDNQLNLSSAVIVGPFPNVKDIPIGFTSTERLIIKDNSSVTLGGSSTTEMTIGEFELDRVTDFKRSAQLNILTADSLKFSNAIAISHLEVPFDDLHSLEILQDSATHPLKSITLPPKAVNWTEEFGLRIISAPDLNLTSLFGADNQGNLIQKWYWPRNITSIIIRNVTIGNQFLYVYLPRSQP